MNAEDWARSLIKASILDGCSRRGFLFAHAISTAPDCLRALVVSLLVDGKPDPEMIRRARELVEECETRRPAGVQIKVEHRQVTSQQLEALQSLVRLVGADEACAQRFGFAVTSLRKIIGEGADAREETDEEFRARIVLERQGIP